MLNSMNGMKKIKLSNGQIIEVPAGVKIINSSSSSSGESESSDDSSSESSEPSQVLNSQIVKEPTKKTTTKVAAKKPRKSEAPKESVKKVKKNTSADKKPRYIYGNLTDGEKAKVLKAFKNASGKRQEKIDQVHEQFGISKYMIAKIVAMDKKSQNSL